MTATQLDWLTPPPSAPVKLTWGEIVERAFGGPIPTWEQIEPSKDMDRYIPVKANKRTAFIENARTEIVMDWAHFQDLLSRKVDALSEYDRNCPWSTPEVTLSMALHLKRNHVAWFKGILLAIGDSIEKPPAPLKPF